MTDFVYCSQQWALLRLHVTYAPYVTRRNTFYCKGFSVVLEHLSHVESFSLIKVL